MSGKIFSYPFLTTIVGWNLLFGVAAGLWPDSLISFSLIFPAGGVSPAADIILDIFRLVSYTFLHTSPGHLLANMGWLVIFGIALHHVISARSLALIYFFSGALGGIAFLLSASTLFPLNVSLLSGASCSVLGVCSSAAILDADHRFPVRVLSGIPLWVIAAIAISLTFLSAPGVLPFAAHAGGLAGGLICGVILRARRRAGLGDYPVPEVAPSGRDAVEKPVIDKLKRSGFSSLTEEEKRKMKRESLKKEK